MITEIREQLTSAVQDSHVCSNCDRQTTLEAEPDIIREPAVYSCATCGQREAVYWRAVSTLVVEEVRVIEEPHIILAEH